MATASPTVDLRQHRRASSNVPLATVGLGLGVLLSVLDQTTVAVALPRIGAELGGFESVSWVITSYVLVSTATAPLYGRLSDLLGRRETFLAAVLLFTVASALSGRASSMGELVAYRALQGLGAGGLFAIPTIALAELFPQRLRGRVLGLLGGVFALATLGGPLAGGVITETLGWRWIFYVNLPLGVLAIVAVARSVRLPRTDPAARIDVVGAALLAGAMVAMMLVAEWGGRRYDWQSGQILALIAEASALLAAFVWWERRAPAPLVPLPLLGNPVIRVVLPVTLFLGALLYSLVAFLPTYFQTAHGLSPIDAGLALSPCVAAFVLASALSGWRSSATGRYKRYLVAGAALVLVGFVLLGGVTTDSGFGTIILHSTVAGIGVGLLQQLLVVVAQNAVESTQLGAASSTVLAIRGLGMTLGVAFFANILIHRLGGQEPTPDALATAIPETFGYGVPLAVLLLVLTLIIPRRARQADSEN